jgi:carboxypeptidase Taq
MMDRDQKNYQELSQKSRETQHLKGIVSILQWDKKTYMPAGASLVRADQLELMLSLIHQDRTSKSFTSALSKLIDIDSGDLIARGLTTAQKSAIVEWRRQYLENAKLPIKFVKVFTKLCAEASHEWVAAKKNNQFSTVSPYLERIVDMVREKAEHLGYRKHPYDAILNEFEPHATTHEISNLFESLRPKVIQLLKKIKNARPIAHQFLEQKISQQKQMQFVLKITNEIGYDPNFGRIDLSAHPFIICPHPHDCRITTRLKSNVIEGISASMHEFGHGLYEMNLPPDHFGSPLGLHASMGIHESQSRWWETRIGQSKSFWSYFLPKLQQHLKGKWSDISLNDFYRAINHVKPSCIRVEADEVTYPLHVMLRFELECALIQGSLRVQDLPDAWNAKMHQYLGITPASHSEGCLQDIHWYQGSFGYFPTYSLGDIYASHFFTAFEAKFPIWEKKISKGEFAIIRNWLKEEIHQYGRQYTATELAKKVTGKALSSDAYVHYLQTKYEDIYV